MFNLDNGRVNLKISNSASVQKGFPSLHTNFILNLYIVYELNTWPRNRTNNFTLKNCLFGTVKLVRNTIKSKFTCTVQVIAFDSSFGNDFARNVVIFGVDNSSSSHTDNQKNKFLVLREGPTQGINDSTGSAEKSISINFSRANTNFA